MLKILNCRFIRYIVFVILICFTGCHTAKIEYVEEDRLPKEKTYRISELFLKDGRIIHLKGTEPKFRASYKEKENVIIYYNDDYKRLFIELKDVDKIKIEVLELNSGLTVLVVSGVLVISAALLYLLFLLSFRGMH